MKTKTQAMQRRQARQFVRTRKRAQTAGTAALIVDALAGMRAFQVARY